MADDTSSNKRKMPGFVSINNEKTGWGWGDGEVKTPMNDGVRVSVNLLFQRSDKNTGKKKNCPKFSESFFRAPEINQMLVTIWILVRIAGSVVFNSTYTSTQPTQLCPTLQPHGLLLTRLLSMGFFGQEYWDGLPFPSPGALPDSGIEGFSFISCTGRCILYHCATWEAQPDAYNNLNLGKKSSFYLPSLPQLHTSLENQQLCNHQREHAGFGAPQNGSSLAHGHCLTCLTAFWKSPIGRVVVLNLP